MSYNSSVYNKDYYKSHCGECYERGHGWEEIFARQADRIVKELSPKKVLDVGCAAGYLVEGLRDKGVEAYGIDISDYAISLVRDDIKEYCKVKSATEQISERYDLITCIEVLEHLSPEDISKAIDNMCNATDMIIFSSTPFDFNEESHYSVNPASFWAEKFAYNGFFHDVSYDCSYIAVQTMLFKRAKRTNIELIRAYEDKLFLLWQENCTLRDNVNLANARIGDLDRGNIEHAQEMEKSAQQISKLQYDLDLANARIGDLDRGNIEHAQEMEKSAQEISKLQYDLDLANARIGDLDRGNIEHAQEMEKQREEIEATKQKSRYLLSKELKKRESLENKILFLRDRTSFLESELYKERVKNEKISAELNMANRLAEESNQRNEQLQCINQEIKVNSRTVQYELCKYKKSKLIGMAYSISNKWKKVKIKFGRNSNKALLKRGIDYWNPVFDPQDYCSYNSDILQQIGNSEEKLLRHFIYYGMNERRRASKSFDIDAYCKYNPDIEYEFGDDNKAIYMHYIENGITENRRHLAEDE